MEDYSQMDEQNTSSITPRGNSFLYTTPIVSQHHHHHNNNLPTISTAFHLQSGSAPEREDDHHHQHQSNNNINFLSHLHHHQQQQHEQARQNHHPIVKTEAVAATYSQQQQQIHNHQEFHYPSLMRGGGHGNQQQQQQQQQRQQGGFNNNNNNLEAIKAKIITHPQYSNLLEAYMDCQKVGAPQEVVARLTQAKQEFVARQKSSLINRDASSSSSSSSSAVDPELDQFMEAYYDMLVKYREELTRPLQDAMDFMRRIEAQLNTLVTNGPIRVFTDEKCEGVGSSEDDQDNNSGGEAELPEIDPRAEDRELKNHLLKKYSGYLSSLKQELSKKKKKGKLPKDARQKLLNWWELHYKWPYPSESEKVALAETTGLDQKQINNWFINQRKRHWKPSEDMQFVVMDGGLHQPNTALYMDGHFIGDGSYRLGP